MSNGLFHMRNAALALALTWVSQAAPQAPDVKVRADRAQSEKRGYWWYGPAPPEPEAEAEESEFADLPPPPEESELLKLHPQQLEKLITDYRQYALWKMTPEHVVWYYELQDFARRRSRAFMNVTQMVMSGNSDLSMNTEYPTTTPGQNVRVAQRQSSLDSRLNAERDRAALVLLSRESCGYCEAQRATLRYFEQKHGWSVREVDLDRVPTAVQRFATDYTPTTILILRGSDEWMPVAVGVESVPGVEEGVYRALRMLRGETSPEQFTLQEFQDGGLYDPIGNSK